jgi:hypothetical protein
MEPWLADNPRHWPKVQYAAAQSFGNLAWFKQVSYGQRGRAFFGRALDVKVKTSQSRNANQPKDVNEDKNLGSHEPAVDGGGFGGHNVIRPGG